MAFPNDNNGYQDWLKSEDVRKFLESQRTPASAAPVETQPEIVPENPMDNSVSEEIPVSPAVPEEISQPIQVAPSVKSYEDELKEARERQRWLNFTSGMARAGEYIGSGISQTKPNEGFLRDTSLEKIGEQEVAGVEQLAKARDLDAKRKLQMSMDDPKSEISRTYRTLLKKSLPQVSDMEGFDNLSGTQLEQLGLKVGSLGQFGQKGLRFERIMTPDGVVRTVAIDPLTGKQVTEVGEAGFAQQTRTDPRSGDLITRNPSRSMGDKKQAADEKKKEELPTSFVIREKLNPKQRTYLDAQNKAFLKDTEKNRDAVVSADNIESLLSAGKKLNGDVLRAIQTQFARAAGEVGAMTERDVSGYGGREDVISRAKRLVSLGATGKLPDSDRKFLIGLARIMKNSASRGIKQQATPYVENVRSTTGLNEQEASTVLNVTPAMVPKPTSKRDSKIENYANQHGLTYDKAKAILQNRGYQPKD